MLEKLACHRGLGNMESKELLITFTMDCEQVGAHQGGPETWALGERAITGFCEALLARGLGATLFVVPEVAHRCHSTLVDLRAAGVEVGLHYHPQDHGQPDFLGAFTSEEQLQMLDEATRAWSDALGDAPQVFRPGNFSANDATFPSLSSLGYLAGSVSCPLRNFPEVRANWTGAPLDAHFAHRANRLLPGELDFLEAPLTVDWESVLWGGRTPLELRLEMVDARAHGFTIRKVVQRQLEQAHAPHLVPMTHNVFDYSDPGEFRRQVLEGVLDEVERAAAQFHLAPRSISLLEMRRLLSANS